MSQIWAYTCLATVVLGAPFPPPNPSHFAALYFGANETGPADSAQFLQLAARGQLAGYGWQANGAPSNFSHGEANLLAAAAALHAAAPSLPVFVYRHFQMCWRYFDVQRAAADDPALQGMFLRDDDNSEGSPQCRQGVPGGGTAPLFAFLNTSAGAWWVANVVAELAAEPATSAVFFDETTWSACGYNFGKDGCANISDAFRAADLAAKLPALRATADALAAARKWPIFSSQNVLAAAWEGLPADAPRPCVVPHDAYAAALEGADYGRFYEFWMGNGKNIDAAYIANVVLEGARGVGFVARASADAGAQCPAACDLSPYHPVDLNYALAAFMVARTSPWSYFGVSGGWSSGCWCWHAQYDEAAKCGAPLAPAVRTSPYSWTREYQRCSVAVNTSDGTGALSPK